MDLGRAIHLSSKYQKKIDTKELSLVDLKELAENNAKQDWEKGKIIDFDKLKNASSFHFTKLVINII